MFKIKLRHSFFIGGDNLASPKVFISSTCYDLKYIRENMKYFVRTIGYEPILSEEGDVFYNPLVHTHDSCIDEIPNSQIFVLIIGGRYGGEFRSSQNSITNHEYKEAVKLKIPVFTLVEEAVYSDHHIYTSNKKNKDIDYTKINYPSVDNIKIFEFIDEVRKNTINNAIVPFKNFNDIECYLRKQWAGMMFNFLVHKNEESRVLDTLVALENVNERIELLSKEILKSVGSEEAQLTVKLFEASMHNQCITDLPFMEIKAQPVDILRFDSLEELVENFGGSIFIDTEDEDNRLSKDGTMSLSRYQEIADAFEDLKKQLEDIIEKSNLTKDEYINLVIKNSRATAHKE